MFLGSYELFCSVLVDESIPIYILFMFHVGNENCASVWSFSVASVENDAELNGNDFNNLSEHEELHQGP